MSTRGQEDETLNNERERKSLKQQMYMAYKSKDPEKISEVHKKVESSSKTTQKKFEKLVRLLEWKKKKEELAGRPNNAEGEN